MLTQTDAAKHKATEVYAAAKTRVIAKLPAAFVPSIVQPAFTTGTESTAQGFQETVDSQPAAAGKSAPEPTEHQLPAA